MVTTLHDVRDINEIPYPIGRGVGYQGPLYPVGNQAGNAKCATGKQLRTRFGIGAWNVRKTKENGKLHTICDEMGRNKLEILGISETNWTERGSFRTHENKTVIYSGKDEGHTMSAKSLGTLPVIYAVDEHQNPLPRKTMLFEGDTNSTGWINDVFPSS